MRQPNDVLPARIKGNGYRQITVTLSDEDAEMLEWYRSEHGLRSWADAIRSLIINCNKRRKTA